MLTIANSSTDRFVAANHLRPKPNQATIRKALMQTKKNPVAGPGVSQVENERWKMLDGRSRFTLGVRLGDSDTNIEPAIVQRVPPASIKP